MLRAQYEFLKELDALQISACHFYKCDYFVTNDKALLQIKEIKNLLLVDNM